MARRIIVNSNTETESSLNDNSNDLPVVNVENFVTKDGFKSVIRNILQFAIDRAHPVGSYYFSDSDLNPEDIFGGKWEKIEGVFLLASSSNHAVGEKGGEEFHKITEKEMPSHSHTKGTMNIDGEFRGRSAVTLNSSKVSNFFKGAFSVNESSSNGYNREMQSGVNEVERTIHFDAKNSWHGETSFVGGNAPHNNMPPFISTNVWKRIS